MTIEQDAKVVAAEAGISLADAADFVRRCRPISRELHAIYERQCNGHQTRDGRWDEAAAARDDAREDELTERLGKLFKAHGLGLYLNGDPRGAPIGVLTPKTQAYNTWGGAECGWRL